MVKIKRKINEHYVTIREREEVFLTCLSRKYNYIARDDSGELWAYTEEPTPNYESGIFLNKPGSKAIMLDLAGDLFLWLRYDMGALRIRE